MLTRDESWRKALEVLEDFTQSVKKAKGKLPLLVMTCQGCPVNDTCEFAWDFYNTNGDCLAEK